MAANEATQAELNKFVKVVDEFKAKYARLISPATRQQILASNNPALISDYESAVSRGRILNNSINALVGAWSGFKRGYKTVTDTTSTVIGDAVDEIRSWFGYDPAPGIGHYVAAQGMGALGLIQVPAAVAVAGVVAAALVLIAAMNRIFITLEANKIQRENPSIPRATAIRQAESGLPSFIPGGVTPIMIGLGALALWFVLGKNK